MKKGWKEVRLGDVIILNYGKALTSTNRVVGTIPVYSSAGITGYHNTSLVNSEGIIVGRKGSVGTVYYSPNPFFCIDTAYYILPSEDYNLKYMYYRIQSLGLENLNEDSAVPGLNRDTAYSQIFSLPPLPEQHAIAAILSCLDDKIANNTAVNHHLVPTMSETDSSPDIRRSKRVSRRVVRHWFSMALVVINSKQARKLPLKSAKTLLDGIMTDIVIISVGLMLGCALPCPRLIISLNTSSCFSKHQRKGNLSRGFAPKKNFPTRWLTRSVPVC